ncbi:uncharacterized protein L201_001459 [Kwoniella dendrophila CBS 6074]|uniref:RNA helicase n=1 Tax=Kwoniella dendrophila CBS 6074 TaxID=1295534 RepID=A0AAX4JMH3_9TREE
MLSLSRVGNQSRISYIALTTPPLRSILFRALHTTSPYNAGGPRPSHFGGRKHDQPRPGRSSSEGRVRPGYGSKPSYGDKPSFGRKPAIGKKPDFGTQSRTPSSTFGQRRVESSNQGQSERRRSDYDKGRIQPTSSRRLMSFDQPPSSSSSSSSSSSRRSLKATSSEVDDTVERTSSPRFPKSQSFQPPQFSKTPTLSDVTEAAPRSFDSFTLIPGLSDALHTQFGTEGKTTPIQTLSFSNLLDISNISAQQNEEANSGSGSRIILGAETGSGKTMSYLIPLFQNLKATDTNIPSSSSSSESSSSNTMDLEKSLYPRSIILSPTHELTRQSTKFAKALTHTTKLSVMGLSNTSAGGIGSRRGKVDVLLGTVGSIRRMLGIKKDTDQNDEDREDVGKGLWKNDTDDDNKSGLVKGDNVEWVVIDEADVLLGADFLPETISILSKLPLNRINLILCTATLPPSLINLLNEHPLFRKNQFKHLLSPGLHKLPQKLETRFVPPSRSGNRLADVVHEIRRVFADDALAAKSKSTSSSSSSSSSSSKKEISVENGAENVDVNVNIKQEKSKIVIFCNSDKKVEQLSRTLESKGLNCLSWTSESSNRIRGKNGLLDEFLLVPTATAATTPNSNSSSSSSKINENRILITTSLLSRGLDFSSSVSSVFLLDPPRDVLDFVHRAGRAGRAGRQGRVVVFGLGDGSGVGKNGGKELQVGELLNKREIKRQMLGGRVKRARL